MAATERDAEVRRRAFQFLDGLRGVHGDSLPYRALLAGFDFEGTRVPLVSQQGIFKPAVLRAMPLSIRTAPLNLQKPRPYDDGVGEDGIIRYKYRGTDLTHPENVGLREAMRRQVPLIYFLGLVPGRYLAEYPVFVVGDDPGGLAFMVQADDRRIVQTEEPHAAEPMTAIRREYVTVLAQKRMHQEQFRARVLRAYRESCAVCRLGHDELLEAAHILPDLHPHGEPVVPNGIALCKIHHAAFDRFILGIRPDLVVEIRKDILKEEDGPMLRYGLQELHGRKLIVVPRAPELKPDPVRLEERYELFKQAG